MAEEESFGDETRQGSLINRWGVLVHNRAYLNEGIDKLWRCGQKTQAQRWIKGFAHSGGINKPARIVQNLKTRQRRALAGGNRMRNILHHAHPGRVPAL